MKPQRESEKHFLALTRAVSLPSLLRRHCSRAQMSSTSSRMPCQSSQHYTKAHARSQGRTVPKLTVGGASGAVTNSQTYVQVASRRYFVEINMSKLYLSPAARRRTATSALVQKPASCRASSSAQRGKRDHGGHTSNMHQHHRGHLNLGSVIAAVEVKYPRQRSTACRLQPLKLVSSETRGVAHRTDAILELA